MPDRPPESARRLALGCDQAAAALVELERMASPALWTGPAASSYAFVVEARGTIVRRVLAQARTAAAAATAAAAGGG
jgi:hypothetical protein